MDGRAGYAVGGFVAGAAAVAVACAVTLSNATALADVPGAVVDVAAVRVSPSPAGPTATPSPSQAAGPGVTAPPSAAEVVPAPEPQDVAAARSTPSKATPAAPATPHHPGPATPATPAQPAPPADGMRSGDWAKLREWAAAHGWSHGKTESWIRGIQDRLSKKESSSQQLNRTQAPAEKAGHPSKSDDSSSHGWKRDQSPQPPRGD